MHRGRKSYDGIHEGAKQLFAEMESGRKLYKGFHNSLRTAPTFLVIHCFGISLGIFFCGRKRVLEGVKYPEKQKWKWGDNWGDSYTYIGEAKYRN